MPHESHHALTSDPMPCREKPQPTLYVLFPLRIIWLPADRAKAVCGLHDNIQPPAFHKWAHIYEGFFLLNTEWNQLWLHVKGKKPQKKTATNWGSILKRIIS